MFSGRAVVKGAIGGLKDSLLEIKDSVIARQEAPEELMQAPTPDDRWFTPHHGWPAEVSEFPPEHTPEGYKVPKWKAPPALTPTAAEAPHLYDGEGLKGKEVIGHLSIEVLQCEGLPRMMVDVQPALDLTTSGRSHICCC